MILKVLILLASFASIAILASAVIPFFSGKYYHIQQNKLRKTTKSLESMFILGIKKRRLFLVLTLAPLISGIAAMIVFKSLWLALGGAALGFVIPELIIRSLARRRQRKFASQLRDTLLIISSSLKVGLSLLQAIETVVEEMPPPTSQEFGLLLKENRIGIPLEDSFENLIRRMPVDELNLMKTAILIARETGGNLPDVLNKLAFTIKERHRVQERLITLTTQGRWQGIIISLLPIFFGFFVYSQDPHFFDTMLADPLGKALLIYAGISEIIGLFLVKRLGRMEAV